MGTSGTKSHIALSSTSGTGHTQHPTVGSLLAAKSACASACGVHASVILFVADGALITLPPPATRSKASILTQHPNPRNSISTTELEMPVWCLPACVCFPSRINQRSKILQFNFGPKEIYIYFMLKNLFRALSSKPSPLGSLTGVSLKIHSFRINSNSNHQQECVVGCWGKKSLYFSYTY